MNSNDLKYVNIIYRTLEEGEFISDRTGVGRINTLSSEATFNFSDGFPLIQVKKTPFKAVLKELLWFLSGSCSIKPLLEQGVGIWTEDAHKYHNKINECDISIKEYLEGNFFHIGNSYGKYFRKGVERVVEDIKKNPNSSRHRVNMWYPEEQSEKECALPPCHFGFQFVCEGDNRISLVFNMRSVDTFLGLPFNIASYSFLLLIVAKLTGRVPNKVVFQGVNVHLYANHKDPAVELLEANIPNGKPTVVLAEKEYLSIDDFKLSDFILTGYEPNPHIYAKLNT